MIPEKRRKCGELKIKLRNARLNLQDSLKKMNQKNEEAVRLKEEIEDLERERLRILADSSADALSFVVRRRAASGFALAGDGTKFFAIEREIKEKSSDLKRVLREQGHFQKEAEKEEERIDYIERQISRNGCH